MREPWCLTPRDVADLTDFQIGMMLGAQARQNERQERAMRAGPAGPAGPPPTGGRIDREFAVTWMMEQHGHTRAAAEAFVDRAVREG
ncbi:hypothetical protein J0H58_28860 [bacterium]|nr:hypothetical protein [bacterium]